MTDKLNVCPFCGSENVSMKHYQRYGKETYAVKCENCGGRTAYWRRAEFASNAWNRRPANEGTEH